MGTFWKHRAISHKTKISGMLVLFFLLGSCSCSCDDDLVFTLTNTSSASIVSVLMASVTLSATNSWFTGALAGGLVTNATITVQCVGKHTLTA